MLDTLKVMGDSQFQPSPIEQVVILLKEENEEDFSSEVKYIIVDAEKQLSDLQGKIEEYKSEMCGIGYEIKEILENFDMETLEKRKETFMRFIEYMYEKGVW